MHLHCTRPQDVRHASLLIDGSDIIARGTEINGLVDRAVPVGLANAHQWSLLLECALAADFWMEHMLEVQWIAEPDCMDEEEAVSIDLNVAGVGPAQWTVSDGCLQAKTIGKWQPPP